MNETVVRECASIGLDAVVIERFPFNQGEYVQIPVDEIENVISGLRKARESVLDSRDGPIESQNRHYRIGLPDESGTTGAEDES